MPLNIPRLPLFAGLDGYQTSALRSDVSAGLAIAAVGLPSAAIAYPAIAGLPPETGLYASIAPLSLMRSSAPHGSSSSGRTRQR
jgi:MFS superfamily sulfate permease-like transporter